MLRENHPLPTIEDFLPYIGRGKFFSKLDIENAFHQVEISPASREITTFITRKGLYRYKRLLFGISCAPELFQKVMERIVGPCDGCLVYIDDIIVYGATKMEHDQRLDAVLLVLKKNNIKLNEKKCLFGVTSLKFLGHHLSATGIRPSIDKCKDIKSCREPRTVEEVRSLLGLINYVGRFIPDLATKSDPLRQLLRKDKPFVWETPQRNAFRDLQKHLSKDPVLGYYDKTDRTRVIADASPVGLGAVLIQFNKETPSQPRAISYASKSLTEAEKRYCQTEKEALALVWAVERFQFYLIGKQFELVTDHKALECIFSPKSKPCARIERWVLRLQSFKYTVIYQPGKMNIADPLSRLCDTNSTEQEFDEETEHYVSLIATYAAPIAVRLSEIDEISKTDDEILAVKRGLFDKEWLDQAAPYKIFETEFCFTNNILLRGTRIVIPNKLRSRVLELGHEGHPGMSTMKQRLRSKVWWPKN